MDQSNTEQRFSGVYKDWQERRIRTIKQLGRFSRGTSILELGSGYGDIGAHFHNLGCDVLCVEGREEHVKVAKAKYPSLPTIQWDLSFGLPPCSKRYDYCFHMGVFYHLPYPSSVASLRHCFSIARTVIFETEILDSNNMEAGAYEDGNGYDQALARAATNVSIPYLEKVFYESKVKAQRITTPELNGPFHRYPAVVGNTRKRIFGLRCFYVIDCQS